MLKIIKSGKQKNIFVILLLVVIVLFGFLIYFNLDGEKITDIKQFIKNDIKILYISKDNNFNYLDEILSKYSINYLKINSEKLTIFERKKIQMIINSKKLNETLLVYKDGVIQDTLIGNKNKDKINKFLQKNNIIPELIVDNVEQIMNESENLLNSEYSMVYIPYKKIDEIDNQKKILRDIAEKYKIEYKKIDAYLLSNVQQEKINALLGLSLVDDQIVILIKDNKMVANIRGVHSKNTYVETLYSVNFINDLENRINEIDYDEFENKLENKEKSIILIGLDDSKDSNEVYKLLNKMIYNYNIEVNYINVEKQDSEMYRKIKEKLEDMGYITGFSTPLVVIVESNKILDYAVGNSKEEYFIDIFIENGVIKGDAINE